jgi:hypothetical protein
MREFLILCTLLTLTDCSKAPEPKKEVPSVVVPAATVAPSPSPEPKAEPKAKPAEKKSEPSKASKKK